MINNFKKNQVGIFGFRANDIMNLRIFYFKTKSYIINIIFFTIYLFRILEKKWTVYVADSSSGKY